MKPFSCACGQRIFFDNVSCLHCSRELGFAPDVGSLLALERRGANYFSELDPGVAYLKCDNYATYGVCNWLVRADSGAKYCRACELNRIIPDLSDQQNRAKWAKMEAAKHRLVYTLLELRLPVVSKTRDEARGLVFDIKADTQGNVVLTGHDDGVVTLKLDEADPVAREKTRIAMQERYRSLLGHFRHESGHYYFDLLLKDSPDIAKFRELFGDERQDYAAALASHYATENSAEDSPNFVSHYATSHPWEDWAETWAHYLHMVDTLETALTFGAMQAKASTFAELVQNWMDFTVTLNALNRSMGLEDAYPFQLGPGVQKKLEFVHEVVARARRQPTPAVEHGMPIPASLDTATAAAPAN